MGISLFWLPIFSTIYDHSQLTDSWLGLNTVEKTEGLNVGRCRVSMDKWDSNGFILEPLGVLAFPAELLESVTLILLTIFGVSTSAIMAPLSIHDCYIKNSIAIIIWIKMAKWLFNIFWTPPAKLVLIFLAHLFWISIIGFILYDCFIVRR